MPLPGAVRRLVQNDANVRPADPRRARQPCCLRAALVVSGESPGPYGATCRARARRRRSRHLRGRQGQESELRPVGRADRTIGEPKAFGARRCPRMRRAVANQDPDVGVVERDPPPPENTISVPSGDDGRVDAAAGAQAREVGPVGTDGVAVARAGRAGAPGERDQVVVRVARSPYPTAAGYRPADPGRHVGETRETEAARVKVTYEATGVTTPRPSGDQVGASSIPSELLQPTRSGAVLLAMEAAVRALVACEGHLEPSGQRGKPSSCWRLEPACVPLCRARVERCGACAPPARANAGTSSAASPRRREHRAEDEHRDRSLLPLLR